MYLVVDGANVVGAQPDGWWRDRAGAATRLGLRLDRAERSGRLRRLAGAAPDADWRVVLVLEGQAKEAELPQGSPVQVLRAAADGDTAMVELAHELGEQGEEVLVVTADRELARLLAALGAHTLRPGALLRALGRA